MGERFIGAAKVESAAGVVNALRCVSSFKSTPSVKGSGVPAECSVSSSGGEYHVKT